MTKFASLEFREVQEAILEAFSRDELDRLLYEELNKNLARWTAHNNFDMQVFELLQEVKMRGIEPEFLHAVYRARPRNSFIKSLYTKARLSPTVSIQAGGTPMPTAGLESIISKRLPLIDIGIWNARQSEVIGQVCQITRGEFPVGTGFLIGPDLVLTNYHVVRAELEANVGCGKLQCRFDFRILPDNTPSLGTSVKLHRGTRNDWAPDFTRHTPEELIGKPESSTPNLDQLDFAALRLERNFAQEPISPGANANLGRPRGSMVLPTPTLAPATDAPVIIVQHPGGAPMKFAIDTSGIIGLNANGTRLRYRTNTEAGSSGSPCFDFEWNLIALHHYGDQAYNHPRFNQGIPIGVIQARLKAKGLI